MKNVETIAENLFGKIRARFPRVSLGDEFAKATNIPKDARFINFDFEFAGSDLGNVTISLNDRDSLKVYYGANVTKNLMNPESKQKWFQFLKELRSFAKMNMLSFDPRDIGKGDLQINDIRNTASIGQDYKIRESVEPLKGTSKTSYQNFGPVRIMIKHSDKVDEGVRGARSRKIDSIYIENNEGERFKMPFKKLSGARAMARHLMNGGQVHDNFGKRIVEMINEMKDLAHFVRATKNTVYEDSETKSIIETAVDHYYDLNKTLNAIKGHKGYQKALEDLNGVSDGGDAFTNARAPADSGSAIGSVKPDYERFAESLKDKLTKKVFDSRFEAALPHIVRAYSNKKNRDMATESSMKSFIRTPKMTANPMKIGKFKEMKDVMKMEDVSSLATKIYEFIDKNEEDKEIRNLARSAKRWTSDLEESQSKKILALEFAKSYMKNLNMNKSKEKAINEFVESIDNIMEGTWTEPDTDMKIKELQALLDKPIEVGVDGNNASSLLYDVLGNDELFNELYSASKHSGPESDARPIIEWWIRHNMPELTSKLDFSKIHQDKEKKRKNESVDRSSMDEMKKLAGL